MAMSVQQVQTVPAVERLEIVQPAKVNPPVKKVSQPTNVALPSKIDKPTQSIQQVDQAPPIVAQETIVNTNKESDIRHTISQETILDKPKKFDVPPIITKHTPMVRGVIHVPFCDVPKTFTRVVISEVINELSVFVRSMDAESQREHSSNEQAIMAYATNASPLDDEPMLMQVVLAHCKVSEKYLRALILKKVSDDRWAVAFLDRGHMAVVGINECRELSGNLQLLRRMVHKCTLDAPDEIVDDAVNRLKALRDAHLIIVYTPPFTGQNPISLQVLSNGMFVKDMISK